MENRANNISVHIINVDGAYEHTVNIPLADLGRGIIITNSFIDNNRDLY